MMDSNNLIDEFLKRIPELVTKYDDEIKDWDEFPGYHNIFGDVLNPFLEELLGETQQDDLKARIFDFLEDMANSDDEDVVNVLVVTVLERIGDSKRNFLEANKYFGPQTAYYSATIEKAWGRS